MKKLKWKIYIELLILYLRLRPKRKVEKTVIYVDGMGCLMCGDPHMASSMIDGIHHWGYYINRMGDACRGYFSNCKEEFRYK